MNTREKGNPIEVQNYRKPVKSSYKTNKKIREEMKEMAAARRERHIAQPKIQGAHTLFKTKKTVSFQSETKPLNKNDQVSDSATRCCIIL